MKWKVRLVGDDTVIPLWELRAGRAQWSARACARRGDRKQQDDPSQWRRLRRSYGSMPRDYPYRPGPACKAKSGRRAGASLRNASGRFICSCESSLTPVLSPSRHTPSAYDPLDASSLALLAMTKKGCVIASEAKQFEVRTAAPLAIRGFPSRLGRVASSHLRMRVQSALRS